MKLITKLDKTQVVDRLSQQVDRRPSLFACLITLNASSWKGTSPVCGEVEEEGFRLRSRQGPGFSAEAVGGYEVLPQGTRITVCFWESPLAKAYKWTRGEADKEAIVVFLQDTLDAHVEAEQDGRVDGSQRVRFCWHGLAEHDTDW